MLPVSLWLEMTISVLLWLGTIMPTFSCIYALVKPRTCSLAWLCPFWLSIIRALCTLISHKPPDQPHLGLPHTLLVPGALDQPQAFSPWLSWDPQLRCSLALVSLQSPLSWGPHAVESKIFTAQVSTVDEYQVSNNFCLDRQCGFDSPLLSVNLWSTHFYVTIWPFAYAVPIMRLLKYFTKWRWQKGAQNKNLNMEDVF